MRKETNNQEGLSEREVFLLKLRVYEEQFKWYLTKKEKL